MRRRVEEQAHEPEAWTIGRGRAVGALMAKPFQPQIVTANDLLRGHVVYRTSEGAWSRAHGDAALAETAEDAAALLAAAEVDQSLVVGPYLAPARLGAAGRPEPTHFREIFRVSGPTYVDRGARKETA